MARPRSTVLTGRSRHPSRPPPHPKNHTTTRRRPSASAVLFGLTMVGALVILVWNTVSFSLEETASRQHAASSTIAALPPAAPVLLRTELAHISADEFYNHLLQEASLILQAAKKETKTQELQLHAMEVGVHRPVQCLKAAKLGLMVHCVEPSPTSFQIIEQRIRKHPVRPKVKLYQYAASATSGVPLDFQASGGTGDHVVGAGGGEKNPWTMQDVVVVVPATTTTEATAATATATKTKTTTTIQSVAIDDIIANKILPTHQYEESSTGTATTTTTTKIEQVFLLKVDVQGHEPAVFQGITTALREQKIDLILTEYWPKGIDYMNESLGPGRECTTYSVAMLQLFVDHGYQLYQLRVTTDPRAPQDAARLRMRQHNEGQQYMPTTSLKEFCHFFYELERKYRDGDGRTINSSGERYEFGYWSDVVAVRPGFAFHTAYQHQPVTTAGRLLEQTRIGSSTTSS